MTAMETTSEYIKAWNDTMVRMWEDRLGLLGVYDATRTDGVHLMDNIHASPVKQDGRFEEVALAYSFPAYGLIQESGTRKTKPRRWFRKAWYSSRMQLKEFLAREIGNAFVGIMVS